MTTDATDAFAPEQFRLDGRRAFVTGGSRGIGLRIARGLALAGASVVLGGRDTTRLAESVAMLAREGIEAGTCAFDVADSTAVREAYAALEAKGPIDILVNNAGIQRRGPLLECSDETWREVLGTNLDSAFYLGRAAARGMVARGSGKILNICSLMSELARPGIAPYSSAKGGLKLLTQAMCAEWAQHGIQVNGIGPGYMLTELNRALSDDAEFDAWVRRRTPAGRWGDPDELAGAAVFLCSPAARFVNGQVLIVDGGLSAVV